MFAVAVAFPEEEDCGTGDAETEKDCQGGYACFCRGG
jgi:hypothetical protein